jgi:hypothetical protein
MNGSNINLRPVCDVYFRVAWMIVCGTIMSLAWIRAENDRTTDLGNGGWTKGFILPDAYLPPGFQRQPSNRHWVIKTVDPGGADLSYTHTFSVMANSYVSNRPLSANPLDDSCPYGFNDAKEREFQPRTINGVKGYWCMGFESQTEFQFNFLFPVGSAVVHFYVAASEGHFIKGNASVPRPSEAEILAVVGQFIQSYTRYVKDQGWMNLVDAPSPGGTDKTEPSASPGLPPMIGTESTGLPLPGEESSHLWLQLPGDSFSTDRYLAVTTLTTLATAGLTALGAGLMMLGTGVKPGEVIDGVKELFTDSTVDTPPPAIEDDFEQWKRDYENRGWRYSESNGVAEFEPVEGATNESGWTYSEERGGFVPPEDQRPQPETPPADASYKEEVRLLQEDLERQRDFLDRERERLRQYEKSGLDDLLPGTREQIRQYETLSDLNQRELERLKEDRPIHTVEDNRDLEADAGERLRSRDTIGQINEGDKKIAAGSEAIAGREREIEQLEKEIQTIAQDARLDPESSSLEKKFLEQQEALLKDGYRVANPGYDAPNLVIREAIDASAFVIDKTGLGGVIVGDFKAIRCGDFAEIGQEKTQSFVNQLYGDKADEVIVDKVFVDVIRDDSLGGQVNQLLDVVAPKNHVANRVILPDGRRYILDYWEGNRGRNIRMVSEEQWLERWKSRLGEDVRYIGSDDDFVRGAQINLMNQAELFESRGQTTEEAFKSFRQSQGKIISCSSRPTADKERQLKQLDTLIQSYRRSGRFHSEGIENYVQ